MGSAQGGSSLDELMLAYTDLSAPVKGHGQAFKGPPVKDIRREAPSQVFQHSNKARDWKTLDQSLESAFGAAPVQTAAPAAALAFTPQQQLLGMPQQQLLGLPLQVQSCEFDEWGEFQDFKAQSSSNPASLLSAQPPPPTHTSQAVGCRLASFQDESPVHRFKTVQPAGVPPPPGVPPPHNIPVNIPNFSAPPLSLQKPLPFLQLNCKKSQPSSILDLDDEFGDFAVPTTVAFTSLTSSNVSLSSSKSFSSTFPIDQPLQPMPTSQNTFQIDRPISLSHTFPIDRPVSTSKTFDIDQPIAPLPPSAVSFPPLATMSASVAPIAPSTASDKYSALRLFLEQPEETPAKDNASQDPLNTSTDPLNPTGLADFEISNSSHNFNPFLSSYPTDPEESDFGDFVEVSASSNVEFTSPQSPLSGFSSLQIVPPPNFPTNLTTPVTATPSLQTQFESNNVPVQLMSPRPIATPPSSKQTPSLFPLQFTSPQPQLRNFPTLLPSPTNQNEYQNMDDEWSLPSTSQLSHENENPTPKLFKPPKPTSIPFLSSSPPPAETSVPSILSSSPPLMSSPGSQLNVEEFSLPSEQFGFSDQEIFGIKKVKKESNQPQSIQDILSSSIKNQNSSESPKHTQEIIEEVKSAEPISPSLENSRQGSPPSLRVPSKSPESQSVASLEFENHTNDAIKPYTDKKPENEVEDSKELFASPPTARYNGFLIQDTKPGCSPFKEWSLLLTEILTLVESTRDTFDNIISEDLKEEVIISEQGKSFLLNITEVHKVYRRVAKSYRQMVDKEEEQVGLEVVGQICDEIDRDWQRLEEHCGNYGVLPKPEDDTSGVEGVCGICLGGGGGLVYAGAAYHPGCANYWVNCVRDTLPRLE
eukprot:GFUD01017035.1.p1 GENE.GFUD01017035.1~~GFUD01017035.1.p1  ORF type:complete len:888 (+),score=267.46 GFUD01017035.1:54-2666(+)